MSTLPAYVQNALSPAGFRRQRDVGALREQTDAGSLVQRRRFTGVRVTERLEAVLSSADYDRFIGWLAGIGWVGEFDYTPPGKRTPVTAVIIDGKVDDQLLDGTLAWRRIRLQVSYDE